MVSIANRLSSHNSIANWESSHRFLAVVAELQLDIDEHRDGSGYKSLLFVLACLIVVVDILKKEKKKKKEARIKGEFLYQEKITMISQNRKRRKA